MVGFILDFGTLKGIATSIRDARAYRQRPASKERAGLASQNCPSYGWNGSTLQASFAAVISKSKMNHEHSY